jgi:hypothetical protein
MKRSLGFSSLLLVMLAAPAESKCYSRWYYPYPQPQPCGRGETGRRMALKMPEPSAMKVQVLPPAPEDEDRSWYVEITALPPAWEREIALDNLKEQLK